jgi:hypothetical protein
MHRRQLELSKEIFVAADMDISFAVFKVLDIKYQKPPDYPPSLHHLLHRKIWTCTLQQLIDRIGNTSIPVFAKPKEQSKRFTGRVFEYETDFYLLHGISRKIDVICTDVIKWLSEYRVYISNSRILGIHQYSGKEIPIDESVVEHAIACMDKAEESVAGYALDFGVIESGETALVEFNDGFALGNYGLDKKEYTELLLARWQELIRNPHVV